MANIVLTGWRSGTRKCPGTLGLRVNKRDRDILFKDLNEVVLKLPRREGAALSMEIELTSSFRSTCREIRGPHIGDWMQERGDCPWPHGCPPRYRAKMSGNRIRILSP